VSDRFSILAAERNLMAHRHNKTQAKTFQQRQTEQRLRKDREDKDRGLEILGFPCNQFKGQEPGSDEEIQDFCKSTYDVTFPVFAKIDVNGPDADPLYQYLRTQAPGDFGPQYGGFYDAVVKTRPETEGTDEVKWNFTKFLIGRDGKVLGRYAPTDKPEAIAKDIEAALAAHATIH